MKIKTLILLLGILSAIGIIMPIMTISFGYLSIIISTIAMLSLMWVFLICRCICMLNIGMEFIPLQYFWKCSSLGNYKKLQSNCLNPVTSHGISVQAKKGTPYLCIHLQDDTLAFESKALKKLHIEYIQWIANNCPNLGSSNIIEISLGRNKLRLLISNNIYNKSIEKYEELIKHKFWIQSAPIKGTIHKLQDRSGGVKRIVVNTIWGFSTKLPVEYYKLPEIA